MSCVMWERVIESERVRGVKTYIDMTNVEFNEYFRKRTKEFAIKTLEVIKELSIWLQQKLPVFN